mmetsp:Transcript_11894/g.16112  ORF Transcript_11894/g.16112 Transcript_11894/m.16112 type:complete len:315 (+) Transcript_11894:150-1094(+)|eukprot:CAMPEP_0197289514 /NCGR_PEP_ID=MMETSP0890-20130614/6799_1 /TAXON_ID=44058 ORGANISM="Aureoumbra lagunensis, Strain CCMP1510" /NCGR_SAMPLE_ID=MMETSP0890 /ASSEMBLY_ACC=CAM_ASM_000533 /LENGTH=314 /DNA_ID=CAMNT_0042760991 /DNA_START=290 /DNA_END=1234 /DNA_ORIENTATION=-
MEEKKVEELLSEYEQLRRRNILRNEEEMRRLGLDVSVLTNKALGRFAPTAKTRKRKAIPRIFRQGERRSERLAGAKAVERELSPEIYDEDERPNKRKRIQPKAKSTESLSSRSSRILQIRDTSELVANFLGEYIPGVGGTQMKRGVMDTISADGPPSFSRMSGIQEWSNAVCLFINVYGHCYKNVFLQGGQEISWFAQSRQWEGTPVIQRLINSDGGDIIDDDDNNNNTVLEPTNVLLFCREENKPFVFCGSLSYLGHDPERVPIRFVWRLNEFKALSSKPAFTSLLDSCSNLLRNNRSASSFIANNNDDVDQK